MRVNPELEMRAAMRRGVLPKCEGKEVLYTDYLVSPSRKEAFEMCFGCPLLELCDAAATAKRPGWGVWGGRVYGANKKVSDEA